MSWPRYAESVRASFGSESGGARLNPQIIEEAARATSPEIARRGFVKWAAAFVEEVKPHLEKTWSSYDVLKKIELVRLTLEPLRETCRIVDNTLHQAPSNKTENELLVKTEQTLLSDELIKELRRWARKDLSNEGESEASERSALARNLLRLGWLPRLEACFTEACYEAVRSHAKHYCAMGFESPMLDLMLKWTENVPGPWLASMLDPATVQVALRRLEFYVHQTFGTLRSKELFDIVTSYPDSMPAVDDLKRCLARTHANHELVATISESLKRRLLHSGANTNSILLVYVRLIKTMRQLDPQGVLLESVAEPIKQYLRTRQETVRCIVTALTNDDTAAGNSDLYDELGLENGTNLRPIDFDFDDDDAREADEEAEGDVLTDEVALRGAFDPIPIQVQHPYKLCTGPNAELWEPDPVEANPHTSSKARMSNDILGNLVRVYGSKELFVSEYRQLLAERLLTKTPQFNTDSEVRRLELLKLRFGEATMLSCDVMLRDVAESRRVSQHIAKDKNMETMIISRHFWPQIGAPASGSASSGTSAVAAMAGGELASGDPPFKVHREVKAAMDEFAVKYSQFKKPRKLAWATNLGLVDVDLQFPDGTRKAYDNLTPLQANIALMFGDRKEWGLNELATQLGLDADVVRKRIAFWVGEGALLEDKATKSYGVAPTAPRSGSGGDDDDEDEYEDETNTMEVEQAQRDVLLAQQEARDKAQLDFIMTMLTNLGASSLEMVHRNLQLFSGALPHGYDRSEQELEVFLEACVEKGHLEFIDNKFRVPGNAQ